MSVLASENETQIVSRSDASSEHISIMFVPFVSKKRLVTYSKKTPPVSPRLTFASPTSHDRQNQRRQVTLTSPVRNANLPTSPNSVLLSPENGDDDDDDSNEVQHAPENANLSKTGKRNEKPTKPFQTHHHTSTQSSSCENSPVSSSENDSIFDAASVPVIRAQRHKKPRLLTTLRKSLNLKVRKLRILQRRPTPVLSTETLKEVQRGADGFDEVHLVPLPLTQRKTKKRQNRRAAAQSMLEVRKGPHPPVVFDFPEWSTVPYQAAQDRKRAGVFEIVESAEGVTKIEAAATGPADHVGPENVTPESPSMSHKKPSVKDVSLYAQLSSVSAPIVRRQSHDEDSGNDLNHGIMAEEEEEEEEEEDQEEEEEAFEEKHNHAGQEEIRDRTIR